MTESAGFVLTEGLKAQINRCSTATLTAQLQRRGIRSTFIGGLKPTHPESRMVGVAHTLRYVALREDVAPRFQAGAANAQRRAVESVKPGDVLVIEARDEQHAATIGDIFVMRTLRLGGVGVVTDGALRDTPAIAAIDIPVYHRASHAATLGRLHMPFSVDEPITCGGVFIEPGDVIVGDGEGVMVIPQALVEDVVRDSVVQEDEEAFAIERVAAGESTIGLFPLSKERRPDYEAWLAARG
jgi:regulator of RNase E activity RraA